MGLAFERIREGDRMTFSKMITDRDIEMFAAITGDTNPIHLDDELAGRTIFKGRIAHGLLTGGLISAAIGRFPGIIIYLSQNLSFRKPVRPGDMIEATAEVAEKIHERDEIRLETACTNQRGELVVAGDARVRVLDPEPYNLSDCIKEGTH
jgi:3-hydroxybutyryl-CoA dehydratase